MRKACWGEEKERATAMEEATELLQLLVNELKEKIFFGGETQLRMVDIVSNVIGLWLGAFEEGSGVQLVTRDKFSKSSS
ncbi:Glutathione S-transferase U8 [Morella rubra]|uniref:Glutathione S-transferase U8 n=1 Tax=Morella rubra TaxID=262757 RepID=A0A6A1UPE3_9ROSI|nr:Glutathione S-transferase U8 [Morella rubra]